MVSFPMSRLIFVAVLFGLTFAGKNCEDNCPVGWINFNLRCYKHFGFLRDWAEAERYCVSQRGNLASVHSYIEYKFLQKLNLRANSINNAFWIGLSDCHKEKTWLWSDGSTLDAQFWNSGQPNRNRNNNEDCVIGTGKSWWSDVSCNNRYRFICSKPQENDFW